jgi:hypothetical protein
MKAAAIQDIANSLESQRIIEIPALHGSFVARASHPMP